MDRNPFWFRERQARLRRKGPRTWLMRGFAPLWWAPQLIVLLLALGTNLFRDASAVNDLRGVVGVTAVASGVLQVLWISTRAILRGAATLTRERDLQTLEVLTCSPMTVGQIVVAKWMAIVADLSRDALLSVPWSLLLLASRDAGSGHLLAPFSLFVHCVAAALFFSGLSLSMTLSGKYRRSSVTAWGIIMLTGFIPAVGPLMTPLLGAVTACLYSCSLGFVWLSQSMGYAIFSGLMYLRMTGLRQIPLGTRQT